MSIPYRPLGMIVEVIEQMDLDVTYAYEDLVFIEHNAFLLRMGEQGSQVYLYFNEESRPEDRDDITQHLTELAWRRGLHILNSGTYIMKSRQEDEQVDIHFTEKSVS